MSHEAGVLTSDLTINLVNHMVGLVFVRKYFCFFSTGPEKQKRKKKFVKSKKFKKKNTLCLFESSDKFILKKLKIILFHFQTIFFRRGLTEKKKKG